MRALLSLRGLSRLNEPRTLFKFVELGSIYIPQLLKVESEGTKCAKPRLYKDHRGKNRESTIKYQTPGDLMGGEPMKKRLKIDNAACPCSARVGGRPSHGAYLRWLPRYCWAIS